MSWNDYSNARSNNFDFIRFVLALAVIYSHSYQLLGCTDREGFARATNLPAGHFAVDAFFSISGFLIARSWISSCDLRSFLKKRCARIYPGFIAATLFGLVVVTPLAMPNPATAFSRSEAAKLVFHLATLRIHEPPGVFADNPLPGHINISLWTIAYEFWCYLAVALLGTLGLLTRRWFVLVLYVAVLALTLFRLSGTEDADLLTRLFGSADNWARFGSFFLSGVVFFLFRNQVPYAGWIALSCLVGLALSSRFPWAFALALPTLGTYALLWTAFHPAIPLHNWGNHGDFSYGIYLYASPLQQLLVMWFPGLTPWKLCALAAPASIMAGIVSWHAIEKHFLKRQRSAKVGHAYGPA